MPSTTFYVVSTRELFAKEFVFWSTDDVVAGFFRVLDPTQLFSKHLGITITTKMSNIFIRLSFLDDLSGLEFLEEFDGRPPVSDQQFIDAFLSL